MKYMILTYGSQLDYDALAGAAGEKPGWSAQELAEMVGFMRRFASELADSGELVETRGLSAPAQARRVRAGEGEALVTDGPYAESAEVLAGYWVVDCESLDRAIEIAGRLAACPGPEHARARAYADVRPIDDHLPAADA